MFQRDTLALVARDDTTRSQACQHTVEELGGTRSKAFVIPVRYHLSGRADRVKLIICYHRAITRPSQESRASSYSKQAGTHARPGHLVAEDQDRRRGYTTALSAGCDHGRWINWNRHP